MGQIVGKNSKKLFGMENVSLKKSEIYINGNKGIQCNNDNSSEIWEIGKTILDYVLIVFLLNELVIRTNN